MILSELNNSIVAYKTITDIDFTESYDVAVVGLGTAGAISALSAAEAGAKVVGIDRAPLCGGTATGGGVFSYYFGVAGGRFEKIDKKSLELQNQAFVGGGCFFGPDSKVLAIEEEFAQTGCKIYYETMLVGVYLNDDKTSICGIKVITLDGVLNFACKVLIDASAEGEVGAIAGAEYILGRKMDGQPQPYSSVRVFHRNERLGMANFDAGYVRPDSDEDMSQAIISANALHIIDPKEEQVLNLWFSIVPGLREGRLLECEERLSFKDFIAGKRTNNPIAWCYSNFDSHTQDWAFEDDTIKDWIVAGSLWGYNFAFPIPLEATIVKGFTNLLCAGRCIGVDHDMSCAIRMQRGMQKIGEAVGITAAMAAENNIDVRHVDRKNLHEKLTLSGALNCSETDDDMPKEDQLNEILSSEKAGLAIWKIFKEIDKYSAFAKSLLINGNNHSQPNAAIALGLAGDKCAVEVLMQMLDSVDNFQPLTSRNYNQRRVLAAIHLLGKLTIHEAFNPLLKLLKDHLDDVQIVSHVIVSLLKIGDSANISLKTQIASELESILADKEFKLTLVMKSYISTNHTEERIDNLLRLLVGRKLINWNIQTDLINMLKTKTMRDKRLLLKITK
jgi:FAD dependent oxidoreductase